MSLKYYFAVYIAGIGSGTILGSAITWLTDQFVTTIVGFTKNFLNIVCVFNMLFKEVL